MSWMMTVDERLEKIEAMLVVLVERQTVKDFFLFKDPRNHLLLRRGKSQSCSVLSVVRGVHEQKYWCAAEDGFFGFRPPEAKSGRSTSRSQQERRIGMAGTTFGDEVKKGIPGKAVIWGPAIVGAVFLGPLGVLLGLATSVAIAASVNDNSPPESGGNPPKG